MPDGFNRRRELVVNMPHMAVGGLSESWLFRELGDMHWMAICEALGTQSDRIADEMGNRLYATFVRFRWEGTTHLRSFRENQKLILDCAMRRFGGAMYFSECRVESSGGRLDAQLSTTFAAREAGNTSLLKGQPAVSGSNPVPSLSALPASVDEYRQVRKGADVDLELVGERFGAMPHGSRTHEYFINPYVDFNGVNLLYFAAYPAIADQCERAIVHADPRLHGDLDWALATSPIARDVMYFGNCDVEDSLVYDLEHLEETAAGRRVVSVASMYRASDRARICRVYSVKERH
jgi:probable biosynthetic protein (TIGR04098 family)